MRKLFIFSNERYSIPIRNLEFKSKYLVFPIKNFEAVSYLYNRLEILTISIERLTFGSFGKTWFLTRVSSSTEKLTP